MQIFWLYDTDVYHELKLVAISGFWSVDSPSDILLIDPHLLSKRFKAKLPDATS